MENPIAAQAQQQAGQQDTLLEIDLDNFSDISMDTVEAAPEFIEPPNGRYRLGVTAKTEEYEKDGDIKKRIRFIYSIQHVEELVDKDALIPADGSMFSENFSVTADGLKYFKTRAMAILGNLGKSTIGEVINALNADGVSFLADTKLKNTKSKDADTGEVKTFTNVNIRVIGADQDPELP
jgi:hypothetical protein